MYAYDRAMRLGSDMLETDIHVTADDKIVVIHDSTVDRTTSGTGSVYDMTLSADPEARRRLLAGARQGHRPLRPPGLRLPVPRRPHRRRGAAARL